MVVLVHMLTRHRQSLCRHGMGAMTPTETLAIAGFAGAQQQQSVAR